MSEEKTNNTTSDSALHKIEEELLKVDPSALQGINKQQKDRIIRTVSVIQHKSHSGPLPDIETLRGYSELIPDGANRVMIMAEKQLEHRIAIESKVVSSQMKQSNRGQFFGLIIGIAALAMTGFCAYINQPIPATVIGTAGITGLVTAFIKGKNSQKEDLKSKRESSMKKEKRPPA